jgi:hypothetical protein
LVSNYIWHKQGKIVLVFEIYFSGIENRPDKIEAVASKGTYN